MIETVQGDNFWEKAKKSKTPALVSFHAQWSGPCKVLDSILKSIAQSYNENLKILKLNIEDNPDIIEEYHIKAYPTLLLMRDGRILERIIGLSDQQEIESILNKNNIKKNS